MNAYVCICSKEYLPYYKVLFRSLKNHSQFEKQILYHIGEVKEEFDEKVDITAWYDEAAYTQPLNKICSLRARVVLDAFSKGYEKVIFLGAKVEFYNSPEGLWSVLESYNALGTPHITSPLPEDGKMPSNASVSFTGHLSTDVVGFRNVTPVINFLRWQDNIMKTQCITTNQVYLDQSWLNFLPFFVDRVFVDKDLGTNMAYWRLHEEQVVRDGKNWKLNKNNLRLICFQFSGLPLDAPQSISTHQNRWIAEGEFLEFLTEYATKVKNNG